LTIKAKRLYVALEMTEIGTVLRTKNGARLITITAPSSGRAPFEICRAANPMHYYPIFLDLRRRDCIVVGGGPVAERKVKALLRAGARVQVISPTLTPRLALLAARKKIEVTPRTYRSGDLTGPPSTRTDGGTHHRPALIFAATNSPEAQEAVRKDAVAVGVWVNTADDMRNSDFLVPASFAQGDLLVAVSTSGASPALAHRLRRQLQVTLGHEYRAYLKFLREARKQVRKTVSDENDRARIFRQLSGAAVMGRLSKGPSRRAAEDAKKWLAKIAGTK
jgi:precorrin-2 dehydrogenase/sirohydrochlorin ferrochelatase